ncbi:dynein light chain 1,cytoplasmic, putative [Entamoeba histolytica HM-1:IMSS-B]|uniref:Dynein light chain n=8 Tax=Entamoeba TaxID=5758 RepID=C4LSR3_ENTH1|nr:dynein light chain 1,cytoplasmic, putative [Entamoeba nuttalli P19]XP_656986.1 dynein light chain 1,cytoplasmic, putative [Entamoeba histolytica HM-1:IMSS]EMD49298.1 dynein light chain 1,cytoplasmic, putative [Entamoeba histolytica KU27]EMH74502.1 dynein light chain 1,cytoplasmic, putative [Entamoeba histolytica HM-1:IMSS-B]EMS10791.1 dynein light chain 1,cytoplasmic, putative [Entamoeba histolytica HM-3:IMSS]ENY60569.1 dynein light chain 1,cytoplasmic, putative [Entamoeba histolytica HM-1:|eukprot:XP_008858514.1 dynein light chain 1,cytoplasmic, putative [Entamoeba nuttalli P19]
MQHVVIKAIDMNETMKMKALSMFFDAYQLNSTDQSIAEFMKTSFDSFYGPTWHCIVGNQFSAFVTHIEGNFIYFISNYKAVMLFRSGIKI